MAYAKENEILGIREVQKYVYIQTHVDSHASCSIVPKIHFGKILDMLVHNIIFSYFHSNDPMTFPPQNLPLLVKNLSLGVDCYLSERYYFWGFVIRSKGGKCYIHEVPVSDVPPEQN